MKELFYPKDYLAYARMNPNPDSGFPGFGFWYKPLHGIEGDAWRQRFADAEREKESVKASAKAARELLAERVVEAHSLDSRGGMEMIPLKTGDVATWEMCHPLLAMGAAQIVLNGWTTPDPKHPADNLAETREKN